MSYPTEKDYADEINIGVPSPLVEAMKSGLVSKEVPVANKQTEGKVRWSLASFKDLEPLIQALEAGMSKPNPYEKDSWKKGTMYKEELCNSIIRHTLLLLDGEEQDKDGFPHIGAIMANAMFYSHHKNNGTLLEGLKPKS
jgi:hypothetical protein